MKLLYAARLARPDLSRAVCFLARECTKWTPECDRALHRLMCYVHSTYALRLEGWVGDEAEHCSFHVYADADFAGCPETKRSTSGAWVCVEGMHTLFPIAWSTKKQTATSHSTPESELVAADFALRMFAIPGVSLWSRLLGQPQLVAEFHEDNSTCIHIVEHGYSPMMRHVGRTHGVSIKFLHEQFERDYLLLRKEDTKMQRADAFTKAFSAQDWPHQLWLISCRDPKTEWSPEPRPLDGGTRMGYADAVDASAKPLKRNNLAGAAPAPDVTLFSSNPYGHMVPYHGGVTFETMLNAFADKDCLKQGIVTLGLGSDGKVTHVTEDLRDVVAMINKSLHSPLLPGGFEWTTLVVAASPRSLEHTGHGKLAFATAVGPRNDCVARCDGDTVVILGPNSRGWWIAANASKKWVFAESKHKTFVVVALRSTNVLGLNRRTIEELREHGFPVGSLYPSDSVHPLPPLAVAPRPPKRTAERVDPCSKSVDKQSQEERGRPQRKGRSSQKIHNRTIIDVASDTSMLLGAPTEAAEGCNVVSLSYDKSRPEAIQSILAAVDCQLPCLVWLSSLPSGIKGDTPVEQHRAIHTFRFFAALVAELSLAISDLQIGIAWPSHWKLWMDNEFSEFLNQRGLKYRLVSGCALGLQIEDQYDPTAFPGGSWGVSMSSSKLRDALTGLRCCDIPKHRHTTVRSIHNWGYTLPQKFYDIVHKCWSEESLIKKQKGKQRHSDGVRRICHNLGHHRRVQLVGCSARTARACGPPIGPLRQSPAWCVCAARACACALPRDGRARWSAARCAVRRRQGAPRVRACDGRRDAGRRCRRRR